MSNAYGILGATELTADDIKALRGAEGISFHKLSGDLETTLVLRRSVGRGRYQTVAEVEVLAASRITDYSRRYDDPSPRPVEADYICHASGIQASVWATVTAATKAGDVLLVEWVRGNDSPAMRDAGAYADELRLHVVRPGKRPTLTYLLSYSVSAGGSVELCRMVRAPRPQYSLVAGA